MRRYYLAAHLYIGLFFGVIFSVIGLSGSILVYYPEIDRLINPELSKGWTLSSGRSYQEVFDTLQKAFPERMGPWRIEIPRAPEQPIFARYLRPEERDPSEFAPLVVAIDPEELSVINARFWGDYFVTWIYDLHYSFLIGGFGKLIVSAVGLFFLVSVLLGIYLWMPRKTPISQRLLPRRESGFSKGIYDLHALTGLYCSVLLILASVTGIGLGSPQWIEPLVNGISERWESPVLASEIPQQSASRIGMDTAIKVALEVFPAAEVRWIQSPVAVTDVYMVRLKQPGELSDRFPKTFVWVDQFNGSVIAMRDAHAVFAGDKFFDWLHPIHNGEALGDIGRMIAFAIGFVPLSMFLTGLLWWRRKQQAKKDKPRLC